jgi:SARP family transcriptional regulator, regulator of embCAB operon
MFGIGRQADRGRLYFGGNLVVAWLRAAPRGRMDYRILGPLEVWAGDRPVALGGEKQRALLAILLLHANEPVSVDGLIDGVWGERPPASAVKTTQGYVARLRRALDPGEHKTPGSSNEILVTRGHGYLLRVSPGELDIDRFRALVEQGRRARGR